MGRGHRPELLTRHDVDVATRLLDLQGAPTPQRITTALDVLELEGPGVDEACGVVEPAVDLWEAGHLVPTAEQLARLASLTGRPVEWFFLPPFAPGGWLCIRSGPGRGCHPLGTGSPVAKPADPPKPVQLDLLDLVP